MIPEKGKFYHFWDDGKPGLSRHYIAKVERIIPSEVAENIFVYLEGEVFSLLDRWKEEAETCNWLYAPETDYFIVCSIPKYDKDPIYFARSYGNSWFSIETTGWWQSGLLDVDGSFYEEVLKSSSEELKEKHRNITY